NELRFCDPRRFGGVWCLTGSEQSIGKPLGEVGLEPLDVTPAVFRVTLGRRRQIKALLMDQTVIAGLGNIYCDESLHAAGIHPLTRSDTLRPERANRLLRAITTILRRAIRFNGSTLMDYRDADGREGSFQKLHRVYQREGEPCRTCRSPIRCIQAAGRSTFFCPRCQRKRRNTKTPKR
ncbi:MAG: zinc finger domain-containing protein, partial [Planctomycetota bacterium]